MVAYAVALVRDDNDTFLVTSRDLSEVTTFGKDKANAIKNAEKAITAAIADRIKRGLDIPQPSTAKRNEVLVSLPTLLLGKMVVYLTMRKEHVTQSQLARDMGVDPRQVRRLLDPRISTHFDEIDKALRILGKGLKVEIIDRAAA